MIELQWREVARSLSKSGGEKEGCDFRINGGVLRQNDLEKTPDDNYIINNSQLLKKSLVFRKAQKQHCECH